MGDAEAAKRLDLEGSVRLDVGGEGDRHVDADLFGGAKILEFLNGGRAARLGDQALLGNEIGTSGHQRGEDPGKKSFFERFHGSFCSTSR